jgi:hypothetical protein
MNAIEPKTMTTNQTKSLTTQIKQEIKQAQTICRRSREELEFRSLDKWDLQAYWQISDYLLELTQLLTELPEGIFHQEKTSNDWTDRNRGTTPARVVEILNEAGKICLDNYDLDSRIRHVSPPDIANYQTLFRHIWTIKELLNIQPEESDYTTSGDYRYPNFGHVYSWAERIANQKKRNHEKK